jgi:hypothetical protein
MARPKKTTNDFPENWKEEIDRMYKRGCCDVEIRSFLGGIMPETFDRMMDEEPEFFEVIKKGRVHAEAWWRELGRTGCAAGKINTGMYALQMRNRFNWYDANKQGEDIQDLGAKLGRVADALEKSDTNTG